MCPPRHLVYIIFTSLRVMPRVSTALHLLVARDDNLTIQIAICNDKYKFIAYEYSILQEFTVDNKVIVTSHSETVRKLHTWRIDSKRILIHYLRVEYFMGF